MLSPPLKTVTAPELRALYKRQYPPQPKHVTLSVLKDQANDIDPTSAHIWVGEVS
jgi:hypothetical protein